MPRRQTATNSPRDALKLEYAVWLVDPSPSKGTQQQWGKDHNVTRQTLWEWQSDPLVMDIVKKSEQLIEKKWVHVLETAFRIAVDADHINCVQAATFLGKAFGKFAPTKLDVTGRMTLADFLARGGYSQEDTQPARVN